MFHAQSLVTPDQKPLDLWSQKSAQKNQTQNLKK